MVAEFVCQRCGKCCRRSGIAWSELDPRAAAGYLKIDLHEFLFRHDFLIDERTGDPVHPEFSVRPCPFLTFEGATAVCTIYPVRPVSCKLYPSAGETCRSGNRRPQ